MRRASPTPLFAFETLFALVASGGLRVILQPFVNHYDSTSRSIGFGMTNLFSLMSQPVFFGMAATVSILLWPGMALEEVRGAEQADVLRGENLVAWCIVPFDAKKRSPAERAVMLKDLGIQRSAYDWRSEHVVSFEQEILEYKKHGIEFFAFWGIHEKAFELFEKHKNHPQIWQTLRDPGGDDATAKVELAAKELVPLAQRTKSMGCPLGLYNHGGWGGEPKNMVAVCRRLRELGHAHVGIVYNFHHGHGHITNWAEAFAMMEPFLICLNLNGMNANGQPKILGLGKGAHELEMIRVVVDSDYDGPIGILDHRNELDTRKSLQENLDGLKWIRKELRKPGSGGPRPKSAERDTRVGDIGRVFPGQEAYRVPPLTVELRATLHRRDRYNILVASDTKKSDDHWELFSMNGTGCLTAYLPGHRPDHVRSEAMICDGKPHSLAMIYEPKRVRLFVDGKSVADQTIETLEHRRSVPGGLGIGQLVEGRLGCDGEIEWVRISRGIREIPSKPARRVSRDPATLGYWNFEEGTSAEKLPKSNPADSTVTEPKYDADLVKRLVHESRQFGDSLRGARVFANAKLACLSCHRVGSHGGTVGPELTSIAKERPSSQLVESVLWPRREVKPEYVTWQILTIDGRVLTGYKHATDQDTLTLREPASGKLVVIAKSDIDTEVAGSTVMPHGLTAAMTSQQQWDLFRFLSELGRDGKPLSDEMRHVIMHSRMHGPAEFPITKTPLDPERWPNADQPVNRDRLYDFYTKQAEHFRGQSHVPMVLAPFPGLDGGQQGHWGNQNEKTWADGRWNKTVLGSVQCGVLRGPGITVPRAVCVRLGQDGEMSTCFNPDTLSYDAVWSGGFVKFDAVRHGFVGGLKLQGKVQWKSKSRQPRESFRYHGFYRHGDRVIFAYRIGDVEYLDSPWVENGRFVREKAPLDEHSLRHVVEGGPPQWPQVLKTTITPGRGRPYAVDTIELPTKNPWNALIFCGGHAFLPDGSAMICTMQGDVWHVSGLHSPPEQAGTARWRRFASGLHHALGMVVSDGEIYVQCRDQLTRLTDRNNDGEADFYECFSKAFVTSPAGHDFICGLQRDRQGQFYTASGNQGLVRISADGQTADVIATGFRNPDGLGLLPNGTVTVPVSEGSWTPASAINAVPNAPSRSPADALYFGYGGPKQNRPPELPLVYLPRGLDNSSGGQVSVDSEQFGPLRDQLLHLSFGAGAWFVVLRDEVDGQLQGAVLPMTGDFLSGVHRGRFNPVDGQLYLSGMAGWGSYTPHDGCFQRVRYTGGPVQIPTAFHTHENGIHLTFAEPVDAKIASDVSQHFAQCWNYRYSGAYGSPEYSPSHPGVAGHDPLTISSAHILTDGRSLFLEIPDLQPVSQLHLRVHVNTEELPSVNPSGNGHDLFLTVHKLDEPFTDFPGYRPRKKTIAAHPMLTDLALQAARKPNPWRKPIPNARPIEIETGKNLTYATREFTVTANEPLALTLSNPDVVPHNWVLVTPGALREVGELGNRLIADPEAYARQYVPMSDDVIAHTDIVSPNETQTIYLKAPAMPGRYPYLCTFPGHWMVMNGVMHVQSTDAE